MEEKKLNKEQIAKMEEQAIDKYEKGAKSYRSAKYRPIPRQIRCQKCGNVYNLMKHVDKNTGAEFWFCKQCVEQRAREIAREQKIKKEG